MSDARLLTGVQHHIDVQGRAPLKQRCRRLSPEKLLAAKEDFAMMIKQGIVRPSSSPLGNTPASRAQGRGGGACWRVCADYTALNSATRPDAYPVPNVLDFTADLHGAQILH